MAVSFRLEEGDDFLSWTTTGDNPTVMTKEEAMVVAVAEIAGAPQWRATIQPPLAKVAGLFHARSGD